MARAIVFASLAVLLAGSPLLAQSHSSAPVVVELFTSEGCSSCPPADALLREFSRGNAGGTPVVVLGEHVDYWNYIGWTDRFSSAAFSQRQQAYVERLHLDSAYTPQMVIDGHLQLVGNDRAGVLHDIHAAASAPKPAQVNLQWLPGGAAGSPRTLHVAVRLPAKAEGPAAPDVVLAITEDELTTSVGKGENAGRTLQHAGVVRQLRVLGKVNGGGYDADVPLVAAKGWNPANLKVVVFAQQPNSGTILGAAEIFYQR